MINIWDKKTCLFLDEHCFKNRVTNIEKELIAKLKAIPQPFTILDFGCGTGRFIEILKENFKEYDLNNYIGVDTSIDMIEIAKSKYDLKFLELSKLKKKTFDVIICLDVLQHQDKPLDFILNFNSYKYKKLFIEFWGKENGQSLDRTDNIIKLDHTQTLFYENIYSFESVKELAKEFNFDYLIDNRDVLLYSN